MKAVMVTGGAGFIGSNFIRYFLQQHPDMFVVNVDNLTYAGVLQNLHDLHDVPNHLFVRGDICDARLLEQIFSGSYLQEPVVREGPLGDALPRQWEFAAVFNFAAESHVDRSILAPDIFLKTNVYGTGVLLDAVKRYWESLREHKAQLRFVQISTDEVYGSLGPDDPPFTEVSPLMPNSPYAAGKAGGDHVVRAYHHTYGLPVLTTRCSNNYGPYQFPEKLIPLMIAHIVQERSLPVYGDGKNVRDWIHVLDHCRAVEAVWRGGRVGDVYNIGTNNELPNLEIVHLLCDTVDTLLRRTSPSRRLLTFVKDRLGHDRRYGLDVRKIHHELQWAPQIDFQQGLRETVSWYLEHQELWKRHLS